MSELVHRHDAVNDEFALIVVMIPDGYVLPKLNRPLSEIGPPDGIPMVTGACAKIKFITTVAAAFFEDDWPQIFVWRDTVAVVPVGSNYLLGLVVDYEVEGERAMPILICIPHRHSNGRVHRGFSLLERAL